MNIPKTHLNRSINYLSTEEKKRTKNLKNPKAFIDCSLTIDDGYENLEEY